MFPFQTLIFLNGLFFLGMRIGADLHENRLFYEKQCVGSILVISGPSRRQTWIQLEILRWKMVSGGLET